MFKNAQILSQHFSGCKLCIFDFDGTLVNLEDTNYGALRQLTKKYLNHDVDLKTYRNYSAGTKSLLGIQITFERIAQMEGITLRDYDYPKLVVEFRDFKRKNLYSEPKKYAKLIGGIEPFLIFLKEKNIHIGIGSASSREFIQYLTGVFKIDKYFEVIIATEDVNMSKPDPETFDRVVKHFNVPIHEVIAFEDSKNGLRSAKAAGLFTVGIYNEGWNDDFVHNLSDVVVDDYTEVLKAIAPLR